MRILVLSDSHGDSGGVKQILMAQQQAQAVIFCGDGEGDVVGLKAQFPKLAFYMVRGNCDGCSNLPIVQLVTLDGVQMMYAHGHTYSVKAADTDIVFAAKNANVQVLCYGHTHVPRADYIDGIYVVNPGSCKGSQGTYGVIDVGVHGILPFIAKKAP